MKRLSSLFFLFVCFCIQGNTKEVRDSVWELYSSESGAEDPLVPQVIPLSPQSAVYQKYLNHKINECTGIPDIRIPLYGLEVRGLKIPIVLSYHASGIKAHQYDGDVVGTVVTGSVAVTYSYNQFLSPDQAAEAQQSILAGIESIANQNAAVSPEYEHQQKRDREAKEKRDQEQAKVAKSIDTNVSGYMPNGDPAPKRGPGGGIWVKLGLGVSGGGAAAATLHSVVEGSQLQVPVPEQHSDQPEIKPQPQPVNWLQTIINLFK